MKGQTSIELILIATIILSVALYLLQFYSTQIKQTVSTAVVRYDVDSQINNLRFSGCDMHLLNISLTGSTFTIKLSTGSTVPGCKLNTTKITSDVKLIAGANYQVNVVTV